MSIIGRNDIDADFIHNVYINYCAIPGVSEIQSILSTASHVQFVNGSLSDIPLKAATEMLLESVVTKDQYRKLDIKLQEKAAALVAYWLTMFYCIAATMYNELGILKIKDATNEEFILRIVPNSKVQIELGDAVRDDFYTRSIILYEVLDTNYKFLGNAYFITQLYPIDGVCLDALTAVNTNTNINEFIDNSIPEIEVGLLNCNNLHNRQGYWNCERFVISNMTRAALENKLSSDINFVRTGDDRLI